MSYKRKIHLLLFITLAVLVLSLSTCYSRFGDVCGSSGDINERISISLILFSTSLFLLSIVFLFTREKIFHFWAKFAKYYLSIAAFLIAISPETGGGFLSFDAQDTVQLTAVLFFIISLIIIIYRTIFIRRKERVGRTNS